VLSNRLILIPVRDFRQFIIKRLVIICAAAG
jgi:hypothetical protein